MYICICNILLAEGLIFSCINNRLHTYTGVAARVFEWGGQKFDKILNLPHYAWMKDKDASQRAFDTPQKQPFIPQIMNKNLQIHTNEEQ